MGFLSAFVENMFFQTDAQRYWQPEHYGLTGIPFTAENTDGRKLDAIMLPAQPKDGKPLDKTVIYCEPGVFNREFNLPQVAYLAQKGFTVVLFDYSGFGISSGKTTIDGLLTDVETVIVQTMPAASMCFSARAWDAMPRCSLHTRIQSALKS